MVNKLKFKGKNDEEILVIVTDTDIEIRVVDEKLDCKDSVFLYPEEWDRIAKFVEVARRKKNAEVHD